MLFRRLVIAAAAVLAMGGLVPVAQAQTGDPSFNLVNRSNRVIYEAYASPSSDSNWGQDRLGQNIVPAGRNFVIRLPQGECIYDLRVVYDRQGGPPEERRNVNLCNLTEVVFDGRPQQGGQQRQAPQQGQTQGPRGNPSFNLVNQGQVVVMEVYASLATDQNWGPDRLGNDTVAPGATFPIRLPEGDCMYDMRFVYQNGQSQERRGVNLCDVTNVTVPLPQ
ncbi:hypothetical protein [Neoroseomonas lacus]|uniref:Tat pathway signal protein n=1 Tax=Neoroseomonas lacus TaxID=287609 RepID=A0A917NV10_9PROT|nr:hypothetical protein [Neoroseomonas lacus]GGJ31145.1 hypothetical protein GCM10011320_43240 [Neoroseomonas lacus]